MRRLGMRKITRTTLIIVISTAIVWMGMQFRPSSDEAAAKVFDQLFSYAKDMPDYMFEQGDGAEPRKVKVNGNQTYLTVQQSDDDITDILDFYAGQYEPLQLDPKFVEEAENIEDHPIAAHAGEALKVLQCMKTDQQFRYQGENYGFWGAFEFRDKSLKLVNNEFLKTLTEGIESGHLGKIGTFRVTMVLKRGETGGSRIINFWTDENFNLNNLHPDFSGDMPGEDIENVPRFDGAVRQFSVEQENMHTLDRLVVYEADGSVVNHILYYHSRMPGEGWHAEPFFEKTMKEQSRDNVMFYKRKGRECTISIDADAQTGKIMTTIMDRKTTNG
jgi:hypothetical protein